MTASQPSLARGSQVVAVRLWGALLALLLLLIACGGGGGAQRTDGSVPRDEDGSVAVDAQDASMPTSADDAFLDSYAAAVCAIYEPCCEAEGLGYAAAGCVAYYREFAAAYFRPRGTYDAQRASACLAALEGVSRAQPDRCREEPSFTEATLRSRCSEAYATPAREGTALGGACRMARECAAPGGGSVVLCYGGRCMLERRGEQGDGPCAVDGADQELPTELYRCDSTGGLYCEPLENTCAPRVSVGEPCPAPDACADGAVCSRGLCVELPDMGEPCLDAIAGVGGHCRPGSACDIPTLTCGAPLAEGETCRAAGQCASLSCGCAPPSCLRNICAKADFLQHLSCTGE